MDVQKCTQLPTPFFADSATVIITLGRTPYQKRSPKAAADLSGLLRDGMPPLGFPYYRSYVLGSPYYRSYVLGSGS